MKIVVSSDGRMTTDDAVFRCAIGRGGIRHDKHEGDGASPEGIWPVREIFYRSDRVPQVETTLPCRALKPGDLWCDDPADPWYNRLVEAPLGASHEALWREDRLYDLIAVLGYNDDPPVPGKGSAIFLHVARPDYAPTEGCAALALPNLVRVVGVLKPGDTLEFAHCGD